MKWIEENPGSLVNDEAKDKRLKRFKSAISFMFPTKKFKTIGRYNGQLNVQFEENNRLNYLDDLSTGEKQIIFRGGFVLRDLALVQGGVIMIDEPELSLHPDWQSKILDFYRKLVGESQISETQIIVATHSPFIVHEQVDVKVVILKKNLSTGCVEVDADPVYPLPRKCSCCKGFQRLCVNRAG